MAILREAMHSAIDLVASIVVIAFEAIRRLVGGPEVERLGFGIAGDRDPVPPVGEG